MNNLNKPIIFLLMLCCSLVALAQTKITGTVLDGDNEPLIGASVVIEGARTGVTTDADGHFTVTAKKGQTINVSYVGFEPAKVKVTDATSYKVVLRSADSLLDEVVVVGYGVQKKVNVTGAVSSIDYSKEAESRPIATTAQALAGASAGLSILQTSGKPGEEEMLVRVRGVGTLNNAEPLVIVDGFESSLSSVNPDDIEKISILKDAASCAIYGNRGANGVILVTTKTPTTDKFNISYRGLLSINEPANHFELVSNYADYMELMNESAENIGSNRPYSQAMIDLWREKSKYPNEISESGYPNYVAYPNTDWMDAMFKKDQIFQRHNLSASGKSGGTSYLISLSYLDNPGGVENTGYNKIQARANITSRINKVVEIGTKMWGYHSTRELNDFGGASGYMSRAIPGIYPYYDGKYGWMENPEANANSRNNLYFINRLDGKSKSTHINGTVFANLYIPYNFKLHASFNYARTDDEYKKNTKTLNAYSFRKDDWAYYYQNLDNLTLTEQAGWAYRWTFESDLSWYHSYGKNDITAMVGFEAQYYNKHRL